MVHAILPWACEIAPWIHMSLPGTVLCYAVQHLAILWVRYSQTGRQSAGGGGSSGLDLVLRTMWALTRVGWLVRWGRDPHD